MRKIKMRLEGAGYMARVKKEDKYAKNPFMQQALVHTVTGTRMIYGSPTGDDTFAAVNMTTGENLGDLQFGKRLKVDKTNFLKFKTLTDKRNKPYCLNQQYDQLYYS